MINLIGRALVAAGLAWFALPCPVAAQDMEPRSYSAAPIGLNFLVLATTRSSGGVVADPALPVDNVEAVVKSAAIGGGSTFSLLGRTALLVAIIPYAWAEASGNIGEVAASISRSGLADPRLKLSVNLLGGRAQRPREFATARPSTIVGASLAVAPPLGQYYPTKLINLGANRWGFKPEIGISHSVGRWTIEGYSAVLLFTANDSFYPRDARRTQERVLALQAHTSYTFRPQLWVAFDATWYTGGTTNVNGVVKSDLQRNSRVGSTLSLPLTARQSIKFTVSTGATTRVGGDFNTVGAAWQLSWFNADRSAAP